MTLRLIPFLAALIATPALAHAEAGEVYYGHYGMMGGGWGGWFFGPIMMLVYLGLIVGAVVLVIRLLNPDWNGRTAPDDDRALKILRERFAKGEIDQKEFEERKKLLE